MTNLSNASSIPSPQKGHIACAVQALNTQAEAIKRLAARINGDFERLVEMILACKGRVAVCGMGKSGLVGRKTVATLASTGTPSFFLHPGEAFHGDLGMITPSDLIILISYSGETEEVVKLIPSLKAFGNIIVAFAGNSESTLVKNADLWIDVSVEREICPNNLAPTTSTLVTMAIGDALAVALINARGFKPMDFARYHPGGSLGRRLLTRARDVMRKDPPAVQLATTFHDCLLRMTYGRMGLVIVMDEGRLVGIVTDGDIRRTLLAHGDASALTVSDFMTRDPHTIPADMRISEAEVYMREHKIRALVVTEPGSIDVIGIVEIYD
ncbi:SIS domain-containing protein [Pusillimonas sp. ANT_WB101]|uniref:KpsF/GutQ family sugar-phosphate isomerase n=1 Tax=Pusillimonas sp. ANT_WB101 TaxID=2597356 RepID=UPI0011EFE57D|nr:KpsF/GutQ family sugar-phosphate isomerase [Pusillimonas sp. ANT_WB101]KAA0911366.1 KpsF/GutQ family sugar-phosphate isomerase [Pusillimonas sp. ANT_WB101]